MRVRAVVRRIGNSFGLIIPHEEVENHNIKEGDVVELEIEKRVNLAESFGSLRFSRTSQELKDEARAGWGE
jgi:antitoxin component of MazEF toxin-antitoxin module